MQHCFCGCHRAVFWNHINEHHWTSACGGFCHSSEQKPITKHNPEGAPDQKLNNDTKNLSTLTKC